MAGRKAASRQACLQLSRRRPPGRPYTHHMGTMAAVDYCRPLRARRSTITTHTHPKQRVSRAEDGHDGRDGPRRDGLGTPCDAPRLTVLRASQQQECIHTPSSCKQICRNRGSQPESSAVLEGVHSPAAGSALLSLQSYNTAPIADTKERRLVSTLRPYARGGRWLPLLNEHTSPDTQVATAALLLLYAVHTPAVPAKIC